MESLVGRGRDAIEMIVDPGTFSENKIAEFVIDDADYGPGAVIGTAGLNGEPVTVIANDAMAFNEKFPVVFAGVIGLEEGYKMAQAVYHTMKADQEKSLGKKRPLILIVDTPGNGPGKIEEIIGMNKATGAYQLALAEARKAGHPIVAIVVGRAISGAFLCHGLQADHILSLPKKNETVIHVMPLTSIAIITKQDIERLEKLSESNPVFASGAEFFHRLGGLEEIVEMDQMRESIIAHVKKVRELKETGQQEKLGPWGRGQLGEERGGRLARGQVIKLMKKEFEEVAQRYINA